MNIRSILQDSSDLRSQGRWEEAELVINKVLEEYPSDYRILMEQADIAFEWAKWSEDDYQAMMNLYRLAEQRYQKIINLHPETAPSVAYERLIQSMTMQSRHSEASGVVQDWITNHPNDGKAYLQRDTLQRLKWSNSKKTIHDALSRLIMESNMLIGMPMLHRKLDCFFSPYVSGPMFKMGDRFYSDLLSRNNALTVDEFQAFLIQNRISDKNGVWNETYKVLKRVAMNDFLAPGAVKCRREVLPKTKKILVSGMGWSGSGAVLSFFKEFESVSLNSETELPYLRGAPSLKTLKRIIERGKDPTDEFIRFFWHALFGYVRYSNIHQMVAARNALEMIENDQDSRYAILVNRFVNNFFNLMAQGFSREKFYASTSRFVDDIINHNCPEAGKDAHFLLNNEIPMADIDLVELLDDFDIFCVVRDPRSQYVSWVTEGAPYGWGEMTVKEFVLAHRRIMNSFQTKVDRIGAKRNHVHMVQFERFVLDESYRNSIIENLGLDDSKRRENTFFKPSVSENNICNYTDFDQDKIKYIESKLGGYCWRGNSPR